MLIFVSIFLILFTLLALRAFPLAVAVAVGALPAYLVRFHLGPFPTTLLEAMILILAAVWLWKEFSAPPSERFLVLKNFWRENKFFTLVVAAFLLAAFISVFVSPDRRAAWGIFKAYFVEPILLFAILVATKQKKENILAALGIGALAVAVFAVLQKIFSIPLPPPWDAERRVTSFFEYPNAVGLFLGPIIILSVAEWVRKFKVLSFKFQINSKLTRSVIASPAPQEGLGVAISSFWFIIAISSVTALIFSKSEGALVGVAAGLILLGLLAGKWSRRLTMTVMAMLLALIIFLPQIQAPLKEKIFLEDWSGYVRRRMWNETAAMIKERPVFGAGLAGYKEIVAPYHHAQAIEIFEYPHNIILNFWSETGFLGLAAFLAVVVLFFAAAFKQIKKESGSARILRLGAASAMFALLVHGLVDAPYFKNDLSALFWVIVWLGVF